MKVIPLGLQRELHIYRVKLDHEDCSVLSEYDSALEEEHLTYRDYAQYAKDILESMGGHHCIALLNALYLECAKEVIDTKERIDSTSLQETFYSDMKNVVDKHYHR